MSRKKYVVESAFESISVQKIMQIAIDANGRIVNWTDSAENINELNSDYINEHFGELQDEAYQRGFQDGKGATHAGCEGCQNEGAKIFELPCSACRNAYPNKWTAKKQDDEIKVGDEVRWGMDLIVVTRLHMVGGFKWCDGISKDGRAFHVLEESVSKTGKHFDIDGILREMREWSKLS